MHTNFRFENKVIGSEVSSVIIARKILRSKDTE